MHLTLPVKFMGVYFFSTLEIGMSDRLPNRNHLNPLNPSGFRLNLLIYS